MTEKPLPTEMKSAEEILKEKFNWTLDSDPGRYQLAHELIIPAMHTHTEQALREFAERVKAGNDLYPELAESHCGCSTSINHSRVDAILDSLLTELQNKNNP